VRHSLKTSSLFCDTTNTFKIKIKGLSNRNRRQEKSPHSIDSLLKLTIKNCELLIAGQSQCLSHSAGVIIKSMLNEATSCSLFYIFFYQSIYGWNTSCWRFNYTITTQSRKWVRVESYHHVPYVPKTLLVLFFKKISFFLPFLWCDDDDDDDPLATFTILLIDTRFYQNFIIFSVKT
jgi:hypothetical protein